MYMFPEGLPLFFSEACYPASSTQLLSEDVSRHIVQVLRMREGEQFELTNGQGCRMLVQLTMPHKRHAEVRILDQVLLTKPTRKISIAVSPLKNASRYEWFLEKAAELGVSEIIPLMCARTEKTHLRTDRLRSILISAMLQSRQYFLPHLTEPMKPDQISLEGRLAYLAHCTNTEKISLATATFPNNANLLVFIGPEGDFTSDEILALTNKGCIPVSLGDTRLRTETAGLTAAVLLTMKQ